MSTLLSPAPDLRAAITLPAEGAVSPEALVGRFEGKLTPTTNGGAVPQFEQPWWTMAAKCLALKMTYEETGHYCDVDKASVQLALRAPAFQVMLKRELEARCTPLVSLFADAGVNAFLKVVEIMEDPKTPKATALAAAREIIDRNLGKAAQTIKHEDTEAVGDAVARVEQLRQENAALRQSLPN